MAPSQAGMSAQKDVPDESTDSAPVLSASAQPSKIATAGYLFVALGHIFLLQWHSQLPSSSETWFFGALAVVELCLSFEALVFAAGCLGRPGAALKFLRTVGRFRLLGAAMAWPWLIPWSVELGCRGHALSLNFGATLLSQTRGLALFINGIFLCRELSLIFSDVPVSAYGAAKPQFGDCLPGNAMMGGQFRLDKADLEETGRAVFVPATPRSGLYIGSGLAVLANLLLAPNFAISGGFPPWQLAGVICALLARQFGQLPPFKGRKEGSDRFDSRLLWRREGPRLVCRLGELLWITFCVLELQRRENSADWLPACESAPSHD